MGPLYSEHIRAARAILRMDQGTFAAHAGLSIETIKRVERSDGPVSGHEDTLKRLAAALASLGIGYGWNEQGIAIYRIARLAENGAKAEEQTSSAALASWERNRTDRYREAVALAYEASDFPSLTDAERAILGSITDRVEKLEQRLAKLEERRPEAGKGE